MAEERNLIVDMKSYEESKLKAQVLTLSLSLLESLENPMKLIADSDRQLVVYFHVESSQYLIFAFSEMIF